MLSKPVNQRREKPYIYIYLGVSAIAVSSVLLRKEDEGVQKPIYYVSRTLHDTELRHTPLEKIVYTLIQTI